MSDKSIGFGIVGASLVVMILYFIWFFAPILGSSFSWLAPYSDLAFEVPIFLVVFGVLVIVLWIGYTIVTTPPPIPLDDPVDKEESEPKEEKR